MKNLFSSPRATRLLAAVIFLIIATLGFSACLLWPGDAAENPRLLNTLCVVLLFGSIYLWRTFQCWKTWLLEYRFGLRLSELHNGGAPDDSCENTVTIESLQSSPICLSHLDLPVREKLHFPWPSFLCGILLFAPIFLWHGVTPLWLLAVSGLGFFVFRPLFRQTTYLSETLTYEEMGADDKKLFPLDKHFRQINDSNFYRYYRERLISLGFQPLGESRHRHFFTSPMGDQIAILGRKRDKEMDDYFSLVSIDEQGRVFESSSFDGDNIEQCAGCYELWQYQSLKTDNIATAIQLHRKFATSDSDSRQFISELQYPTFAKYFYAVTSIAKTRHYNQNLSSFA